ncbi:MAG: hypothetical protein WBM40_10215 [Thiohalocapsa sp.]
MWEVNVAENAAIMSAPAAANNGVRLLPLLKTYLDMIALRKGPDAVPSSWLVVYFSVLILAVVWFLQVAMFDRGGEGRMLPAFGGYLLALLFYGGIVSAFGFPRRIKQTLSSIIACGSIIAAVAVVIFTVLVPLVGTGGASVAYTLIWYWSVPVKGHIIALAINQHWFVGVTIAIAAFIMRLGVETAFITRAPGA